MSPLRNPLRGWPDPLVNWPGLGIALIVLGVIATGIAYLRTREQPVAVRRSTAFRSVRATATVPVCVLGVPCWISLGKAGPGVGYTIPVAVAVCAIATVAEITLAPGPSGTRRLSGALHMPFRWIQILSMLVLVWYDGSHC